MKTRAVISTLIIACIGGATLACGAEAKPKRGAPPSSPTAKELQTWDKNKNGKLDPDEKTAMEAAKKARADKAKARAKAKAATKEKAKAKAPDKME